MTNVSPIANRDMVADSLAGLSDENRSWLMLLMENPAADDTLLDGLHLYLDRQSEARILNSLKLQTCAEWLGGTAPARLQVRLMEAARSSQHAAYASFREGLVRSGGLERAYPKAKI
ncbi:hypothetical protein REJC140_00056 [Pseudorhizobium endolithicum]|uniref:Uncharacterized protein n=1 Tax=Pseudorhizobium endolithicum TaxID=1191678 RepID=A0ABM8PC80_9HYPH|nr:hypothetical protein [Pseudorhizobium endolithicum]CAD6413377.1 hypothetical protein REQ54_01143 [Rhizobium sp. Q54]CAD7022988.1 hypothetical protein REJC140_00056 [Pseudorhizobium endolithicum]